MPRRRRNKEKRKAKKGNGANGGKQEQGAIVAASAAADSAAGVVARPGQAIVPGTFIPGAKPENAEVPGGLVAIPIKEATRQFKPILEELRMYAAALEQLVKTGEYTDAYAAAQAAFARIEKFAGVDLFAPLYVLDNIVPHYIARIFHFSTHIFLKLAEQKDPDIKHKLRQFEAGRTLVGRLNFGPDANVIGFRWNIAFSAGVMYDQIAKAAKARECFLDAYKIARGHDRADEFQILSVAADSGYVLCCWEDMLYKHRGDLAPLAQGKVTKRAIRALDAMDNVQKDIAEVLQNTAVLLNPPAETGLTRDKLLPFLRKLIDSVIYARNVYHQCGQCQELEPAERKAYIEKALAYTNTLEMVFHVLRENDFTEVPPELTTQTALNVADELAQHQKSQRLLLFCADQLDRQIPDAAVVADAERNRHMVIEKLRNYGRDLEHLMAQKQLLTAYEVSERAFGLMEEWSASDTPHFELMYRVDSEVHNYIAQIFYFTAHILSKLADQKDSEIKERLRSFGKGYSVIGKLNFGSAADVITFYWSIAHIAGGVYYNMHKVAKAKQCFLDAYEIARGNDHADEFYFLSVTAYTQYVLCCWGDMLHEHRGDLDPLVQGNVTKKALGSWIVMGALEAMDDVQEDIVAMLQDTAVLLNPPQGMYLTRDLLPYLRRLIDAVVYAKNVYSNCGRCRELEPAERKRYIEKALAYTNTLEKVFGILSKEGLEGLPKPSGEQDKLSVANELKRYQGGQRLLPMAAAQLDQQIQDIAAVADAAAEAKAEADADQMSRFEAMFAEAKREHEEQQRVLRRLRAERFRRQKADVRVEELDSSDSDADADEEDAAAAAVAEPVASEVSKEMALYQTASAFLFIANGQGSRRRTNAAIKAIDTYGAALACARARKNSEVEGLALCGLADAHLLGAETCAELGTYDEFFIALGEVRKALGEARELQLADDTVMIDAINFTVDTINVLEKQVTLQIERELRRHQQVAQAARQRYIGKNEKWKKNKPLEEQSPGAKRRIELRGILSRVQVECESLRSGEAPAAADSAAPRVARQLQLANFVPADADNVTAAQHHDAGAVRPAAVI